MQTNPESEAVEAVMDMAIRLAQEGRLPSHYEVVAMEKARSSVGALTARITELERICGEAYQVVGILLSDSGQFGTDHGDKILDNLSEARIVHDDILPWACKAARHG